MKNFFSFRLNKDINIEPMLYHLSVDTNNHLEIII